MFSKCFCLMRLIAVTVLFGLERMSRERSSGKKRGERREKWRAFTSKTTIMDRTTRNPFCIQHELCSHNQVFVQCTCLCMSVTAMGLVKQKHDMENCY